MQNWQEHRRNKDIVLVGLCLSAAQGLRAVKLLPSRAHRVSELLQHCCKVKAFKMSSEAACSHCCPLYWFQIRYRAHALAPWTRQQPCTSSAFHKSAAQKPRLHFRRGSVRKAVLSAPVPNETAQPRSGEFGLLPFDSSLYLICSSCCASRAVRCA